MILITGKFYFYLIFRVSNLGILFELVTEKFYFNVLFRVNKSTILICLFNSS